jgi:hypothetical protein
LAVLAILATVWAYGRWQYSQSASDERAAIQQQQIAIALGQQVEKDRADAQYRGRVLATQMAQKDLAGKLADSGRMLHSPSASSYRMPEPAADLMAPEKTGSEYLERAGLNIQTWQERLAGSLTR